MTSPLLSRFSRPMWYILAVVIVLGLLMAVLVVASWQRPGSSLQGSRLAACPGSPNCVCSYDADAEHAIPPLTLEGDGVAAVARLRTLMESWPRTRLVKADDDYLWVEVSTPLLAFVDDVEFLVDRAAGVVHVRSASRVGRSDLGANRARVEAIRQAWSATVTTANR